MQLKSDLYKPGHLGWIVVVEDPTRRVIFEDPAAGEGSKSHWDVLPHHKITEVHIHTPFQKLVSLPFHGKNWIQYKHCQQRVGEFFGTLMGYTIGAQYGDTWTETFVDFTQDQRQDTTMRIDELRLLKRDHPYYQEALACVTL